MTKLFTVLFTSLLAISNLFAQHQITTGTSYKKQNFFKLSNEQSTVVNNTDWDIAFSVFSQSDAGVFLNEAVGTGNPPQVPLKLYKAPTNTFTDAINSADLKDSLYNDEKSWFYGAFNAERNQADYFDYGWGKYNSGTKEVIGNKVFVIKLRTGAFRKIEIQKLGLGYTFRHANLDGSDENTISFKKSDFAGKTLAYYSFADNAMKNLEPAAYDILYTRYLTKVEQNGAFLDNYPVTGILSGRGVQIAKATGVDPFKVSLNDYLNKFEKNLDVIGHDWKTFSLATNTWTVPTDRAYFVKTAAGEYYKIIFIDFEGAATGTASFEKEKLEVVVSTSEFSKNIDFKVYPTLTDNELNIVFDNKNSEQFEINIANIAGQTVSNYKIDVQEGFQVRTIDVSDYITGNYIVTLKSSKGIASSKFVKL